MRRSALLDSVAALRGIDNHLAELVLAQTQKPRLAKPDTHIGGPLDDFFQVELSGSEADEIIGALMVAEGAAVADDGSTTLLASSIGSLVDLWQSYFSHVHHEA